MAPPPPPGTSITPSTNGRGRTLKATRRFPAGTLIGTFSNPLLAVPDGPSMRTTCNYCLLTPKYSDGPRMRACTGCQAAVYCGPACQRAHWKSGYHKAECGVFKRIREKNGKEWLPTPVRALVQVLLLMEAGDEAMAEAFVGERALEGNVERFRENQEVWEDYGLQAMAAVVYGGILKSEDILNRAKEVLCRISTNAFHRREDGVTAAGTVGGIFLDYNLSMVNHSCVPNAFVGFDKRAAMLRAERDIEVGEDIEIAYCDRTAPRTARQERLKSYYFECQCPRCRDDLDIYECCSMSPNIKLNTFSLQPELAKYRNPQVDRSVVSKAEIESIQSQWHSLAPGIDTNDVRLLRQRWELCKPLVEAKMWAVDPVPSSVIAYARWCQPQPERYAYLLPLACFLVTEVDPILTVAPFFPDRIPDLIKLAKILSRVGELRATGELEKACTHKRLVEIVKGSDQVSMCQVVLYLILYWGPMGASEDWDLLGEAEEMLQDILSLKGREQESYFLRTWAKDLKDPEAAAFVKNVVLKPIQDLAALAIGIIEADLGDGQVMARR